jgi:hypothetical protein
MPVITNINNLIESAVNSSFTDPIIKQKYEANANTNAFTDEHKNKVDTLINQDVTTSGTPSFASVKLVGGDIGQGDIQWNTEDQTLDLSVGNGVSYQLGQELGLVARNTSGTAIPNGAVVKVVGASGSKVTIALADYSTKQDSSTTFAVATESIGNNNTGRITTEGLVRGLDTSAFAEGSALWLGSNGLLTGTRPIPPNYLVHVGWVIRSHATEGSILVKIGNGWEVGELHNVLITSIADNDLLVWDAGTSLWINTSDINLTSLTVSGNILVNGSVDGRNLSADGAKLDGIEAGATGDQTKADIDALGINAAMLNGHDTAYFTSYTDTAVASLVANSPETLNTLNELASALGDDPNFATTVSNMIGTKVAKTGDTMTGNLTVPNLVTPGLVDGRDVSADGAKLDTISLSTLTRGGTSVVLEGPVSGDAVVAADGSITVSTSAVYASTSTAGMVQLENTLTSSDSTRALTGAKGKELSDRLAILETTVEW